MVFVWPIFSTKKKNPFIINIEYCSENSSAFLREELDNDINSSPKKRCCPKRIKNSERCWTSSKISLLCAKGKEKYQSCFLYSLFRFVLSQIFYSILRGVLHSLALFLSFLVVGVYYLFEVY